MRNEIYEKISQSRKRYLAELNQKNNETEAQIEKPLVPIESVKLNSKVEPMIFHIRELIQPININWEIKSKLGRAWQKIPLEGIKQKLNKLSTGIKRKIRKTNQRFSHQSDKFMENFVSYSNQIFEDRYESIDPENLNMNSLVLETTTDRQIVWDFADGDPAQGSLPGFSVSQLGYLLEKIENTFMKTWKNFRFSIEFEGASIEYNDKTGTTNFDEKEKTIEFEQISKEKGIAVFSSILNSTNEKTKEYESGMPTSQPIIIVKIRQFFHRQFQLPYFDRLKKKPCNSVTGL